MHAASLIDQFAKPLSIVKRAHVFEQGSVNRCFYIVKKGILKAYYLSEDGKETVKSFLVAGDIIGSLSSIYNHQTCTFSLVCLQESELLQLEFDEIYQQASQQPAIATHIINFLIQLAMKKERREYELLCLSAEERYILLQQKSPDIIKYVRQNDIAHYLGITPVALSRIKSRLNH